VFPAFPVETRSDAEEIAMAGEPNSGMKGFYLGLGAIAAVGFAVILYLVLRPATVSIPVNVAVQASDTAGFQGYVLGSPSAPVEITEFADYQCPYCQTFATIQMPAVKERLIDTGRLRFRYRDFPLDNLHSHARLAAHAAACAADQDKYWPMHDKLYEGQGDWAFAGNAAPIFHGYAQAVGLDAGAYDACMKSAKFAGRIQASYELGQRYGVGSTPTLMVGGKLWTGRIDSDAIIHLVDSLAPRAPAPAGTDTAHADSAARPAT
jgi:protein-disulfide isomerase